MADQGDVTKLLQAAGEGASGADEQLLGLIYEELRGLARRGMAGESDQTVEPTALVHEAFYRLLGGEPSQFENRRHFFGAAARAMRRILVERARKAQRGVRGGDRARVSFEDALLSPSDASHELIALDEALQELSQLDPRKHEVVMLRYFAGLTIDETAENLGISPATVKTDWAFARGWLYQQIRSGDEPDQSDG